MRKEQLSFLLDGVYAGYTKNRGRGVFTNIDIAAETTIELSPVIVLSGADRKHIDQTLLHDYIFEWGEDKKDCCMALGIIPLYNHSYHANCEYEMFFKKQVMRIKAIRDIKAGEELFINYNGTWIDNKPIWFEVK